MIERCHLGAGMWANKHWVGSLFRSRTANSKLLAGYAEVFNTVEASGTFHRLPGAETVARWRRETPDGFRFCFHLPRGVTHGGGFGPDAAAEAQAFFRMLEPLADRVGLLLLRMPPAFGAGGVDAFEAFLPHLSKDFAFAVEVRHLDFHRHDETEQRWTELLATHGLNYAMFDTAVLHGVESAEPSVLDARRLHPAMPQRRVATGQRPWIGYLGHNEVEANDPHLARLALAVAEWIEAGLDPHVFIHSPDQRAVPQLCRCFHRHLAKWADVGRFPDLPGEREGASPTQMDLFD